MTAVRNADEKGVKTGVKTIKGAFGSETRQKKNRQSLMLQRFPFGEPGGIRTHDLLIRSQTLYPAELRAHMF